MLLLSGCANEIGAKGKTASEPSSSAVSSAADSSSEAKPSGGTSAAAHSDSSQNADDSTSAQPDSGKESKKEGIAPPEDNGKLNVLLSVGSSINAEQAKQKFTELGGNANIKTCADSDLFNRISAASLADDPVDVASFDNGLMYPYGISQDMIEPMDSALNLNAERWQPYMETAKLFTLNGWHYVLPINVRAAYGLYYYKDSVKSVTGYDPAELAANGEWTNEKFDEMVKTWHDKAKPYGLAGWYGQPMMVATGKTLVGFDENTSGFFNNCFDWDILAVADELYYLKGNAYVTSCPYVDLVKALDSGAMFYSGTMLEGEKAEEREQLTCVPMPSQDGKQHFYQAYIDGLVLVKGIKNTDSARCFIECVSECDNSVVGKFADSYMPAGAKPAYSYGMGISPRASTDASQNGSFPLAIIPFIYSAPQDAGEWDSVCAYYAEPLTSELTIVNNKIRKIYGD